MVAHLLQSQRSIRRLLGGLQFPLADYEQNETHILGMVNTCVLAACFTLSCWMKPSPVPPVHQRCPEHQSQAYGEGKVLCNRRGKTKVAFPRFLCPLLLLLPPSQLVRCLCQPGGHGGLLATGTLLPAAGKAEQDRGAQGWRRASLERRMGEGRMRKSGRAELHF